MKKIAIHFQIQSLESKQTFDVIGEKKNNRIKFVDPENNRNYIIFHNDIVEYYKKGKVDMKYKFTTTSKTKGFYTVDSVVFEFDIVTTKLIRTENSLVIEYRLYDRDEIINETRIEIKYSTVEEE